MRWDSPFVLAFAGTLAIHVLLAVIADAIVLTHPAPRIELAPHVDLIEIDPPPILRPPPPPVAPAPQPEAPKPAAIVAHHPVHAPAPAPEPPPIHEPPPPAIPPSGGDPVVQMPDVAPAATGVAVATGGRTTGHIGRGGTGGGTGAGSGAGSADAPVSVATIKTRAMPRGDYGFASIKDYPEEAKQLGIEGQIRVRLIVDEHGKVRSSTLLNKLGHGLDELALKKAAGIEFEPARDTDDHPVTSIVVWTFTMTLPK